MRSNSKLQNTSGQFQKHTLRRFRAQRDRSNERREGQPKKLLLPRGGCLWCPFSSIFCCAACALYLRVRVESGGSCTTTALKRDCRETQMPEEKSMAGPDNIMGKGARRVRLRSHAKTEHGAMQWFEDRQPEKTCFAVVQQILRK